MQYSFTSVHETTLGHALREIALAVPEIFDIALGLELTILRSVTDAIPLSMIQLEQESFFKCLTGNGTLKSSSYFTY
jgi:hypothetical protein